MRNYRASAGSQIRIDYGIALSRGLANFDATRPHAGPFKALNDELDTAYKARIALRKPWLEARQDVRFADYNADVVIRAYQRAAEIADGSRRGAICKATLPEGVTPVIAPSGASQLPAINELIKLVTAARVPGIEPFRDAELPKLVAAQTQLDTAVTAYRTARDAYNAAFVTERAIRDEHRLAVDAMMGTVRSLFPGDTVLQDIIFPEASVASGKDAEEDDADTDADPVPVTG